MWRWDDWANDWATCTTALWLCVVCDCVWSPAVDLYSSLTVCGLRVQVCSNGVLLVGSTWRTSQVQSSQRLPSRLLHHALSVRLTTPTCLATPTVLATPAVLATPTVCCWWLLLTRPLVMVLESQPRLIFYQHPHIMVHIMWRRGRMLVGSGVDWSVCMSAVIISQCF